MPLQLHRVPESHLPRMTEIPAAAFHESADPSHMAMFPNAPTAESRAAFLAYQIKGLAKRGVVFLAVYDVPETDSTAATSTTPSDPKDPDSLLFPGPIPPPETMIAAARLRLEDPITFAEPPPPREVPPSAVEAAFDAFFGLISPFRKLLFGCSTFWVLEMLATAPEAQGRGAGTLIMQWMVASMKRTVVETASGDVSAAPPEVKDGENAATELRTDGVAAEQKTELVALKQEVGDVGVPGYIEAFKAGTPLYRKMGFVAEKTADFDTKAYGGVETGRVWFMVRPAEAKGLPNGTNGV